MHLSHSAHLLAPPSVLGSDGWVAWQAEKSGLTPERVEYTARGNDLPRLEGTIYVDKKGRLRQPRFGPYLPLSYTTTPVDRTEKLYRQWISVAEPFAQEIVKRGVVGYIALPPGMLDARPFQWAGLDVKLHYTFASPLPIDPAQYKLEVRKRTRKAIKAGYVAERSTDWDEIMACLVDTEAAHHFTHKLDAQALSRVHTLMGDESFRGYVVRDQDGVAVSGGVRLHQTGSTAIDWLQGTRRSHLSGGVAKLMYSHVLDDLAAAGASDFDYGGANINSVAAAKAAWGIPLVPYLNVGGFDARNAYHTAKSTKKWLLRSRNSD